MRVSKIIPLFFLMAISCNITITKEQYLVNYGEFIEEIKNHYKEYNEVQWIKMDEEFEMFNVVLLNKFKNQLTLTEQTKILRFDFVYNLMRGNITINDLISGKYNQFISSHLNEVRLLKKDIQAIISIELINKLISSN